MRSNITFRKPGYKNWAKMKSRCLCKNSTQYKWYGGRGITICQAWIDSYEAFWKDMKSTWEPELTLDRIDNNKGYCKENCRWADAKEQCSSRRQRNTTVFVETPHGRMSVAEAVKKYNIPRTSFQRRIKAGRFEPDMLTQIKYNLIITDRWHETNNPDGMKEFA